MEGKLSKKQKFMEFFAAIILLISSSVGVTYASNNKYEMFALSFIGIIIYVIFLTITFFPVTWNMTKNKKKKSILINIKINIKILW